jgi:hypothetical protein
MSEGIVDWVLSWFDAPTKPEAEAKAEPLLTDYCERCKAMVEVPHDCPKIGTNW